MVPVVPALVQLKVRKNPFAKAAGVRTDASVTAICDGKAIASDRGELQLTAFGFFGFPWLLKNRLLSAVCRPFSRSLGKQ